MQGIVKWFSQEKGIGYIIGNDSVERFFGVVHVKGASLPKNGDRVEFDHGEGKKGPIARNISITKSNIQTESNNDSRIVCEKCNKKSVPRLWHEKDGGFIFYSTTKHICPFCGVTMYTTGGGVTFIFKLGLAIFLIGLIADFIGKLF